MRNQLWWSASAVSKFRECPRAWFFSKVLKVPERKSKGAEFGSEAHALREMWFKSGRMPEGESLVAKCAREGLQDLPLPKNPALRVEERFRFTSHGLGVAVGVVDVFIPYPLQLEDTRFALDEPVIIDHKFLADPKYMKSTDDLLDDDPQAGIYGKWALSDHRPDAGSVAFYWHNVIKSGRPQAIPVRVRASRGRVEENFGKVLRDVGSMLQLFQQRETITPRDVQGNAKACSNYGGCSFRDICPISAQEQVGAIMQADLENKLSSFETQGQQPAPHNNFIHPAAQQPASQQHAAPPQQYAPPPSQPAPQPPQATPQQQFATPPPPVPQQQQFAMPPPAQPPVPQQAAMPTLAQVAQGVTPPDAPVADLNAKPEEKSKRGRPKKDQALSRREAFSLAIFQTLVAHGHQFSPMTISSAIGAADEMIKQLDATAK